jgi:hypothetical protein
MIFQEYESINPFLSPTNVDRQSHPFFKNERMASNWRRKSPTVSSGDNGSLGRSLDRSACSTADNQTAKAIMYATAGSISLTN